MSMKNSSDTAGNQTRDLPACSAVPQPTALQSAHLYDLMLWQIPAIAIDQSLQWAEESQLVQNIHKYENKRFKRMHKREYKPFPQ